MCKYTHKYYLRYIKNVARHYCPFCDKFFVGAYKWTHQKTEKHKNMMQNAQKFNNVENLYM